MTRAAQTTTRDAHRLLDQLQVGGVRVIGAASVLLLLVLALFVLTRFLARQKVGRR